VHELFKAFHFCRVPLEVCEILLFVSALDAANTKEQRSEKTFMGNTKEVGIINQQKLRFSNSNKQFYILIIMALRFRTVNDCTFVKVTHTCMSLSSQKDQTMAKFAVLFPPHSKLATQHWKHVLSIET
jgi:hypothetical protein